MLNVNNFQTSNQSGGFLKENNIITETKLNMKQTKGLKRNASLSLKLE